mmetsp:Transcript_30070/g.21817  ORF Transcript_30070/g.21817 Transcript_30070/m.21817 type:complete len:120 (+) Transcript_30070:594-953(+)|eukprot:CAMPEP_0116879704 /NCGR_PEP_ID=MMETSP0463-20121206/11514_1 /TAXON_ID=181622 /ORGANISM="Strombidinopsis sp, Strain SopsisLIS2011" /LENGTH=119 /DNA_ID=CAMNT_0004529311 /DNA_START=594 /DNA_END=953 /DNA_ORIENTATION=+
MDYRKIALSSLILEDPNVLFVATNDDPVYRTGKSGRLCPDVGATLHAIEFATGMQRKAVRLGKPHPYCYELLKKEHNIQVAVDKVIYIGDNLNTDIKFGNDLGMGTCLVYTGITQEPTT